MPSALSWFCMTVTMRRQFAYVAVVCLGTVCEGVAGVEGTGTSTARSGGGGGGGEAALTGAEPPVPTCSGGGTDGCAPCGSSAALADRW